MEKTKKIKHSDRLTVTVYVTAAMKKRLIELSEKNGRSETKQVLTMLSDWLDSNVTSNLPVPKIKNNS